MQHLKLKAAVNRFTEQAQGLDRKQLIELILADTEKGFNEDEANEIADAMIPTTTTAAPQPAPTKPQAKGENANRWYEKWRTEYDAKTDEFTKIKLLKSVFIEPDMADRMNQKSHTSNVRFYAV